MKHNSFQNKIMENGSTENTVFLYRYSHGSDFNPTI